MFRASSIALLSILTFAAGCGDVMPKPAAEVPKPAPAAVEVKPTAPTEPVVAEAKPASSEKTTQEVGEFDKNKANQVV